MQKIDISVALIIILCWSSTMCRSREIDPPMHHIKSDSDVIPAGGNLKLSIMLGRSEYQAGELLDYKVVIHNVGNKPFKLEAALYPRWHVMILLYDVRGKFVPLPNSGPPGSYPGPVGKEDYIKLGPGFFYGRDYKQEYPVKLLRPGRYMVEASLFIMDESKRLGFPMWHGRVHSPRIPILIRSKPVRTSK